MSSPNIPVRNLWLLMLYGSDVGFLNNRVFASAEENPEKLPDLITELLCDAVESRLRNGLTLGFQSVSDSISRVRGRIDFLTTHTQRLLDHGRIRCTFDVVSPDTETNRFVLCALRKCLPMLQDKAVAARCRRCIHWMRSLGVSDTPVRGGLIKSSRRDRGIGQDQLMITLAGLALEMKIPSETEGGTLSYLPVRDERWLRVLFEKAVAGFYRIHTRGTAWKVTPGKWLNWQIEEQSDRVPELLPKMKTDIFLENQEIRNRIIIDTKFNEITVEGRYRDRSFRSGYLYQMYAYAKSQKKESEGFSVEGVLLHPAFGEGIDESVVIQGDRFRFVTIDLMADHQTWRTSLRSLLLKPKHNLPVGGRRRAEVD